ncbi:MAG: hypothetical protein LBO20_00045, partial [Bifidobacteriaceae bacterium]|nr:hypothetical protein [Bifidobacteriaceae bacterium]
MTRRGAGSTPGLAGQGLPDGFAVEAGTRLGGSSDTVRGPSGAARAGRWAGADGQSSWDRGLASGGTAAAGPGPRHQGSVRRPEANTGRAGHGGAQDAAPPNAAGGGAGEHPETAGAALAGDGRLVSVLGALGSYAAELPLGLEAGLSPQARTADLELLAQIHDRSGVLSARAAADAEKFGATLRAVGTGVADHLAGKLKTTSRKAAALVKDGQRLRPFEVLARGAAAGGLTLGQAKAAAGQLSDFPVDQLGAKALEQAQRDLVTAAADLDERSLAGKAKDLVDQALTTAGADPAARAEMAHRTAVNQRHVFFREEGAQMRFGGTMPTGAGELWRATLSELARQALKQSGGAEPNPDGSKPSFAALMLDAQTDLTAHAAAWAARGRLNPPRANRQRFNPTPSPTSTNNAYANANANGGDPDPRAGGGSGGAGVSNRASGTWGGGASSISGWNTSDSPDASDMCGLGAGNASDNAGAGGSADAATSDGPDVGAGQPDSDTSGRRGRGAVADHLGTGASDRSEAETGPPGADTAPGAITAHPQPRPGPTTEPDQSRSGRQRPPGGLAEPRPAGSARKAPLTRVLPHVTVVVKAEDQAIGAPAGAWPETGAPVPVQELARILCDCDAQAVTVGDDSQVLDVGRAKRFVTPKIRI